MSLISAWQILVYLAVLLLCVKPLGLYMARVYEGQPCGLNRVFSPLERLIYRLCGVQDKQEMGWKAYLYAVLWFNFLGFLAVYLVQQLQFFLPLNPQHFPSVSPEVAFNTAASFATNTNWQAYGGETTMSYLTQMSALTVQNFLSAATGMAVLVAFIRGLCRKQTQELGNFWVDMTRGVLYILLPLSFVFAIFLASQGVIQNFKPYETTTVLDSTHENYNSTEQIIPMGPVASQVAIKQLGTNGGGFFNTNSAHPFENPNPLTNFLELLAILLIPAALCYTFGVMVKDKRQGWGLLIAMLCFFVPLLFATVHFEHQQHPELLELPIDQSSGNMEGKETRFGVTSSAMWGVATTATSNGSVNAMHDSFTPLGGLVLLGLMQLGEVVFGGVGSGLYGMLIFVILTVFIAGLMVGRTPEYLGKKIEPYEMMMTAIAVLIMPICVLIFTAIASVTTLGTSSLANPGSHGLSEMLYAFTSMVNNNGSAFAGLNASTPFYTLLGGIGILIGRFGIIIPVLAIAGSMANKKSTASSSGTLPTHNLLFIVLLITITLVMGALTFLPVLALGPIAEHLMLWGHDGH